MLQIIKSEQIKMRHTIGKALILLIPVLMIAMAVLLCPPYLYGMSMNFWYSIFFFIFLALSCSLVNQKENKKLQYRNVYQLPVNLSKVWRGKIYMIAIDTAVSANLLGLFICICNYMFSGSIENGFVATMLAVNLVWIINLWQIPIYLFTAKTTGFYVPFVLGGLFSVFGVIEATKASWWIYPMSWIDRIMCTVIHYQPNGLKMTEEDAYLIINWMQAAGVLVVALLLFGFITWLTAMIFERRSCKC